MLDQLRYFQAVARCGSLSAAARVLQVSQPGLTAVIKQLEEGFGTKLLVRLRTGVSLTSTGKELLRFADESLARLEEVEHRINGLESDEVGSFVIGFLYNFGQAKFPDLAYVILFLPMVLVLVVRPQGLFGRRVP